LHVVRGQGGGEKVNQGRSNGRDGTHAANP
jgi:hypothetical protein